MYCLFDVPDCLVTDIEKIAGPPKKVLIPDNTRGDIINHSYRPRGLLEFSKNRMLICQTLAMGTQFLEKYQYIQKR
jgi:hypothetical protein